MPAHQKHMQKQAIIEDLRRMEQNLNASFDRLDRADWRSVRRSEQLWQRWDKLQHGQTR